ncbi:MAG: Shedu immune nuclease family protein [Patescibacteria group bacterium]
MPEKRYVFRVKENKLYIVYIAEDVTWVFGNLELSGSASLRGKVFTVTGGEILSGVEHLSQEAEFPIGKKEGEYYKISPQILSTQKPIFIHESVIDDFEPEDFFVRQPYFERTAGDGSSIGVQNEKFIPIFPVLEKMFDEVLRIGGEEENSIPLEVFKKAISVLPDRKEVKRYLDARIAHIIGEYITPKRDFDTHHEKLIAHREAQLTRRNLTPTLFQETKELKKEIFQIAYDELKRMLNGNLVTIPESEWQDKILDIILLLYPKYVHKEKSVEVIKDQGYGLVDIMLFDAAGFVDLIEVKKPEVNGVGVLRKALYRKNYVPSRELSGAIMQVEKYSFWLSRWGKKGEEKIQQKYANELPDGMKVKIANPTGIIIFGRDEDFNEEERQDFEVIKRKYKHVVDILTYDDLLRRIANIINILE